MTFGAWIRGDALAVVEIVAVALAATSLHRRLVPAHRGAHGVLVTAVIGVSAVLALAQLLGTVGAFARWPFLAATLACAVGTNVWPLRRPPPPGGGADGGVEAGGPGPAAPGPGLRRLVTPGHAGLAVGVAALVTAWVGRIVSVYRIGSSDGDSLMYHLPFADHFVRTGRTTSIPDVSPTVWVSVYPANVELTSAMAMLPFRHEALVPLLSLGWLALALLAAWCVGDTVGRGPVACLAAAAVLASPVISATQGGTARVDLTLIALVLAAAAILLHRPLTPGSCLVAGLALGFALGAKATALALGGVMLVGVATTLWRRRAAVHAAAFGAGAVITGTYWYARNWVVTGSPLPMFGIEVPGLVRPFPHAWLAGLDGTSVVAQLGTPGFIHRSLMPAAALVAGSPVMVVVAAAALVMILAALVWRRPVDLVHVFAVAAVVGAAVYLVAPNGAPVTGFATTGFGEAITALNMRYLLPSLAVLFVLAPVTLGDRARRLDPLVGAGIAAYVVYLCAARPLTTEWPLTARDVAIAVAIVAAGTAVVAVVVAATRTATAPIRGWACAGALGALALLALTPAASADFAGLHRYAASPPDQVALWDHARERSDERIAVLGDWLQHPLVTPGLQASTSYLGTETDRGVIRPALTCPRVLAALRQGRFDRLVIQNGLLGSYGNPRQLAAQVSLIPRATVVFQGSAGLVVDLPDELPAGDGVCGGPAGSPAGP